MSKKVVLAAVGVVLENENGEVLLGLRIGSHGAELWGLPGGKIDFGERAIDAAKREVLEETGIIIDNITFVSATDDLYFIESDGKHFVVFGFKARVQNSTPKIMETNKCKQWKWFDKGTLPENIFKPSRDVLECMKNNIIYKV